MKSFFGMAALAMSLSLSGQVHADASLDAIVEEEMASLDTLPDRHLKSLLTRSQPRKRARPEVISYTRDWLETQPKAKGDAQWRCLAEALYFEARGETVKGQFAVAEVIMNRVRSKSFPSTPCGVVNQGTGRLFQCQFTFRCDGHKEVIREPRAYERVAKVARAVLDGANVGLTDGATHYHTTSVRPRWSRVFHKTARIGVHIFYRPNIRTASN